MFAKTTSNGIALNISCVLRDDFRRKKFIDCAAVRAVNLPFGDGLSFGHDCLVHLFERTIRLFKGPLQKFANGFFTFNLCALLINPSINGDQLLFLNPQNQVCDISNNFDPFSHPTRPLKRDPRQAKNPRHQNLFRSAKDALNAYHPAGRALHRAVEHSGSG